MVLNQALTENISLFSEKRGIFLSKTYKTLNEISSNKTVILTLNCFPISGYRDIYSHWCCILKLKLKKIDKEVISKWISVENGII